MTTFQGLVIIRESRIGPCRGSRAASQFRRQKSDYDSDDSDNDSDNGSDKCSDKCSDKRSDNEGPGDDSPARCVPQRPAPGRGRAAMSRSPDRGGAAAAPSGRSQKKGCIALISVIIQVVVLSSESARIDYLRPTPRRRPPPHPPATAAAAALPALSESVGALGRRRAFCGRQTMTRIIMSWVMMTRIMSRIMTRIMTRTAAAPERSVVAPIVKDGKSLPLSNQWASRCPPGS